MPLNSTANKTAAATAPPATVFNSPLSKATTAARTIIHTAFCDICSEQTSDTKENLLRFGWGLHHAQGFEYCPFHEEMI